METQEEKRIVIEPIPEKKQNPPLEPTVGRAVRKLGGREKHILTEARKLALAKARAVKKEKAKKRKEEEIIRLSEQKKMMVSKEPQTALSTAEDKETLISRIGNVEKLLLSMMPSKQSHKSTGGDKNLPQVPFEQRQVNLTKPNRSFNNVRGNRQGETDETTKADRGHTFSW